MRHGIAACIAFALLTASCDDDPARTLDWQLELDGDCVESSASSIALRILVDGCGGLTEVFAASVALGSPMPVTPELAAGRYGFEARAVDDAGTGVGYGCAELTLPLTGDGVRVVVSDDVDTTCGPPSPPPDGGVDAGPPPADGFPVCDADATCDDGLDCTDDCRSEIGCFPILKAGYCLIDGACFRNGEGSPDDACQACNTKLSSGWWPAERGTECGNEQVCDGLGRCVPE